MMSAESKTENVITHQIGNKLRQLLSPGYSSDIETRARRHLSEIAIGVVVRDIKSIDPKKLAGVSNPALREVARNIGSIVNKLIGEDPSRALGLTREVLEQGDNAFGLKGITQILKRAADPSGGNDFKNAKFVLNQEAKKAASEATVAGSGAATTTTPTSNSVTPQFTCSKAIPLGVQVHLDFVLTAAIGDTVESYVRGLSQAQRQQLERKDLALVSCELFGVQRSIWDEEKGQYNRPSPVSGNTRVLISKNPRSFIKELKNINWEKFPEQYEY